MALDLNQPQDARDYLSLLEKAEKLTFQVEGETAQCLDDGSALEIAKSIFLEFDDDFLTPISGGH